MPPSNKMQKILSTFEKRRPDLWRSMSNGLHPDYISEIRNVLNNNEIEEEAKYNVIEKIMEEGLIQQPSPSSSRSLTPPISPIKSDQVTSKSKKNQDKKFEKGKKETANKSTVAIKSGRGPNEDAKGKQAEEVKEEVVDNSENSENDVNDDIDRIIRENDKLREKINNLNNEIANRKAQNRQIITEKQELEDILAKAVREAETKFNELRQELKREKKYSEKREALKLQLLNRIAALKTHSENQNRDVKNLKEDNERLRQERFDLREENEKLSGQVKELFKESLENVETEKKLQQQIDMQAQQLSTSNELLESRSVKIAQLEDDYNILLDNSQKNASTSRQKMKKEIKDLKEELEKKENDIFNNDVEIVSLKREIARVKKENDLSSKIISEEVPEARLKKLLEENEEKIQAHSQENDATAEGEKVTETADAGDSIEEQMQSATEQEKGNSRSRKRKNREEETSENPEEKEETSENPEEEKETSENQEVKDCTEEDSETEASGAPPKKKTKASTEATEETDQENLDQQPRSPGSPLIVYSSVPSPPPVRSTASAHIIRSPPNPSVYISVTPENASVQFLAPPNTPDISVTPQEAEGLDIEISSQDIIDFFSKH